MKNKKLIGGLVLILIAAIASYFLFFQNKNEPTKEDDKVKELLQSQKERSDSMKRALGIE